MNTQEELYGAVEAGGTKFMCALGRASGDILEEVRIETRDPASTLSQVIQFFLTAEARRGKIRAFGVGAFGPLELRRDSPQFGFITTTPKAGWANTDLLGTLQRAFARPFGFDTDVNGAALAEWRWGAALVARTGHSLSEAGSEDPVWDIEADYLGQLCAQLVLMHSPQRILLGGGVMHQERLFAGIRARMLHWLQGYVPHPELQESSFIAAPGLGAAAGIKGALALAADSAGT
jgi:predicted NBD/HSP70 family sugar kinase